MSIFIKLITRQTENEKWSSFKFSRTTDSFFSNRTTATRWVHKRHGQLFL